VVQQYGLGKAELEIVTATGAISPVCFFAMHTLSNTMVIISTCVSGYR